MPHILMDKLRDKKEGEVKKNTRNHRLPPLSDQMLYEKNKTLSLLMMMMIAVLMMLMLMRL